MKWEIEKDIGNELRNREVIGETRQAVKILENILKFRKLQDSTRHPKRFSETLAML